MPTQKPRVWILSYGVTEANKAKLDQLASQNSQAPIGVVRGCDLAGRIAVDRGSLSQFGCLFLGTILPESVHQVLHLDGDTVIKGPLGSIGGDTFDGAMGVSDTFDKQYKQVLGIPADRPMFNPGVRWIDLDAWRQDKIEDKFIAIIQNPKGQGLTSGLRHSQCGTLRSLQRCIRVLMP